jgi:threonine dehydratase
VLKILKPSIRVFAVQARVNSALAAAFEAGGPRWIDWQDTVVEGASTPLITDEMNPLLSQLVDELVLVGEDEVMAAISLLSRGNKLVTEGAGAAALATPTEARGLSVCVVSGGSVDRAFSPVSWGKSGRVPIGSLA